MRSNARLLEAASRLTPEALQLLTDGYEAGGLVFFVHGELHFALRQADNSFHVFNVEDEREFVVGARLTTCTCFSFNGHMCPHIAGIMECIR